MNTEPTAEILDGLMVALSQSGTEYISSTVGGMTVISAADYVLDKHPEDTVGVETVPQLPEMSSPEFEVTLSTDPVVGVSAIEVPAPTEVPVDLPPEPVNPAPIGLPNAIIKSFSLAAQVKAVYDSASQFSYLKSPNVDTISEEGFVKFTYGGMIYRYPYNAEIRTVPVVFSFTGKEHEQLSISISIVQTDQMEELVFGTDATYLVQSYIS
jgi:hypothetical protein